MSHFVGVTTFGGCNRTELEYCFAARVSKIRFCDENKLLRLLDENTSAQTGPLTPMANVTIPTIAMRMLPHAPNILIFPDYTDFEGADHPKIVNTPWIGNKPPVNHG